MVNDNHHDDDDGEAKHQAPVIDQSETKPIPTSRTAFLTKANHSPVDAPNTKTCMPLVIIDLLDDESSKEKVVPAPPSEASHKRLSLSSREGVPEGVPQGTDTTKTRQDASLPSTNNKFQVVSYNVWFGPANPEASQVHPQQRMAAIGNELKSCHDNLVVVGLQELTPSLQEYLSPILTSMDFRLCTQPLGGGKSSYGVGLAISKQVDIVEIKFIPFPNSCQGRGFLFVQTSTWLFATTHLESYVDHQTYNGTVQREAQIVQATIFCERRMEECPELQMVMIAGDFNWDDERLPTTKTGGEEGAATNRLLKDVVGPHWHDAGQPFDYTYDDKENPMLSGNLRRRFDRCIYSYKNKNNHNQANMNGDILPLSTTLRKLGMKAIPALTWNNGISKSVPVAPSDHFGIAITFDSS
jgi:endonuclease/exonuclease/phosphatase family metal-dependent hydrolase